MGEEIRDREGRTMTSGHGRTAVVRIGCRRAGIGPQRFALFLVLLAAMLLIGCGADEPETARAPSAGPGVSVIETPLAMPGLDRERTIRIYLPPDYATSSARYPVLYMHDGQNLFDDATSYAGEWGVDEALDQLAGEEGLELIVVGIDNGAELRTQELVPWALPDADEPQPVDAPAYLAFITDTVKPWVDEAYRTRPEREHTGIMGSSFGGIASHYALLQRPDVFSRFGVFSPSYWVSEEVFIATGTAALAPDLRLYLQMGENEGDMVPGFERMAALLHERGLGPDQLVVRLSPDGEHHESTWRQDFPDAVRFLFGSQATPGP